MIAEELEDVISSHQGLNITENRSKKLESRISRTVKLNE